MNFLKMAQDVRLKSGVQGTGPSSAETTGYDQIFLVVVRDVWRDIQAAKKTWKWMRVGASFQTQLGKTTYTPAEVFGPNNRFKRYYDYTFYIQESGKKCPMRYVNYDYYIRKHSNDTNQCVPKEFTIRESDNALIFPTPNGVYWIFFDYHKTVQTLTAATDVPECPEDYHPIIVYGATASYCLSMSMAALQQEYSQRFTESYDQMVREQVPRETFKIGGIV